MFRDKDKELKRLEEALILEAQEEEAEVRLAEELAQDDDLLDDPDDFGEETEQTYHNFANCYGKYKAYNTDNADTDLDDYSQRVYEKHPNRGIRLLCALAVLLLLAICAVLGWCALRYTGALS